MVTPQSTHLVPLGTGPVATVYAGGGAAYKVFPVALDRRTRTALEREVAKWRRVPFTLAVRGVEELADGVTAVCSELCRYSLAARVRHDGALPVAEVLDLGQVLAEALGAAHTAGLVHGGVTATNVLFRASGEPVLADGGLAVRRAFPSDPPVDFAAPETVRDAVRDARTDLYGLGAVLYLALTGEVPYPGRMGERAEERLLRVLGAPVPEVTRPDLPAGLADVVRALLARDPDARPADVATRLAAIAGVGFDDFADTTYHPTALTATSPFAPMPTPPAAAPPRAPQPAGPPPGLPSPFAGPPRPPLVPPAGAGAVPPPGPPALPAAGVAPTPLPVGAEPAPPCGPQVSASAQPTSSPAGARAASPVPDPEAGPPSTCGPTVPSPTGARPAPPPGLPTAAPPESNHASPPAAAVPANAGPHTPPALASGQAGWPVVERFLASTSAATPAPPAHDGYPPAPPAHDGYLAGPPAQDGYLAGPPAQDGYLAGPPAHDGYLAGPPAPPVRMPLAEVKPGGKKPDRAGRLGVVAGIAGALALFAAAPFLLLGEDAPPPPPGAATMDAPTDNAGVQIELEVVEETGNHVRLAWRSSAKLDYVVIVAPEGRPNEKTVMLREQTKGIDVEPGRKYCFEVHGTDGDKVYISQPKGIRGAVCAR